MGYQIDAFLVDGKPCLKIYDLTRECVYLEWTYTSDPEETRSHQEVQRLFRELLLLTCKQDIHNVRTFNLTPTQLGS